MERIKVLRLKVNAKLISVKRNKVDDESESVTMEKMRWCKTKLK